MKSKYLVILLIAAAFITYSNTLANKFTAEDYYLIANNDFVSVWNNVKVLFGFDNMRNPIPIRNGARPFTLLSLMVDYKLWHSNPFGFHLTNVILHIAVSLLVFLLFNTLGLRKEYSFMTALIFAMHPVQGEIVNVPGFRGDLLAAFFYTSGIILFVKALKTMKYPYFALVFVCYFCAVLAKEVAIVFPLLIIAYFLTHYYYRTKLRAFIFSIPFIIFGGMYLMFFWIDRYSYDIFKVIFVNLTSPVRPFSSVVAYINTLSITFVHYLKTILWPFSLSYEYQFSIPYTLSLQFFVALAAIALMTYYALKTKDKVLKFCFLMTAVAYLPASNLLPLFNIAADRYMYIPMIGISYILFKAGSELLLFIKESRLGRKFEYLSRSANITTVFSGSLVVVSVFMGVSFNRNYIFKDMFTLFKQTSIEAPVSPRVCYNLAVAYREKRMWAESNKQLEKLVELNPLYKTDRVWQMLGENYQLLGDDSKAKEYYVKLLMLNPKRETLNNLAKILLSEGNVKSSSLLWKRVLAYYPNDSNAREGLELIERFKGEKP